MTELQHAWHALDLRTLEYALRMSSYVTEALESSDVTTLVRQCSEIFLRIQDDLTVTQDGRALHEYNRYVRDVLGRALSALCAISALHKNEGYLTPYRSIRHILDSSVPSAEKYRCLLVEFMEALQPARVGYFPEAYSSTSVGRVRTVIMRNATQLYICSTTHDRYINQLHECLLKILEKVPFLLATCERILLVRELLARISDINAPQPASAHAESLQLRYLDLVTKIDLALSRRSEIAALGGVQEPEMSLPYVAKLFEIICSISITNLVQHRTEYPGLRATLEQLVQLGRDIASSGFLNAEQSVIFGEVHLPLVERMRELCKHIDKYTKYATQGRNAEAMQKWHGEIMPLLRMVSGLTHAAQVSEEDDTHGSGEIFRKVRLKPICQPSVTTPQNSSDIARHKYRRRCVDRFYSGLSHLMCNVHFLDSVMGQLDAKISRLCLDAGTGYDNILSGSPSGDRLTESVYCYLATLQGTTQVTVGNVANSNALIDTTAALLSHALVMLDGHHISRTRGSSVQEQHNHAQSMVCGSDAESVRKLRYLAKLRQHMASCALVAPPKRQSAHADTLYIDTQSHFLAGVLDEGVPIAQELYPTFSAVTCTHYLDTPPVVQEMPLPREIPGTAARTQYVAHESTARDMSIRGAVRSGTRLTHCMPRESVIKNAHEFPSMQEYITTHATGHASSPGYTVSADSGASGQSAVPVTAYLDGIECSGNSLGNSSPTSSPQVAHTLQHHGHGYTALW
ncbi:hypothetical protein [Anaplasma centrale]|uniref:hypothetical protein n=1 Tax=Anaplasma centrale TaxID=769 RepID=UPI001EE63049|nr:hypothetical protein [Anaplasma centrale]